MEIRVLTPEDAADLALPNDPFTMPGRFIPSLQDGEWSWRAEYWERPETMAFPAGEYDFETLNQTGFALGAYENGACVGLAVLQNAMFEYMYLWDLNVRASHRGKGVGKALMAAAVKLAQQRGFRGIYCQAQDNNLNACLFYLHAGFQIGGFDNRVYTGTKQENKGDVLFYWDVAEE